MNLEGKWSLTTPLLGLGLEDYMAIHWSHWDQILNFLALRPNAGPTQTHVGYRCTPYDFLVHVEHVFFEDKFFGFRSILHRCVHTPV